jgi:hypothetical protein
MHCVGTVLHYITCRVVANVSLLSDDLQHNSQLISEAAADQSTMK